jgi:hypothetical protein
MKLVNVTGTSDETCACDSWLDHWKTYSGQSAGVCGVMGCNSNDLVGAHVRKYGESTPYIYPLCNGCNQKDGALEAWDGYKLVDPDACQ